MTEANQRIKILIVDDHQIVRQGLRTFLELHADIEVVGEAENGLQAVELVRQLEPDVVLMDLVMPRLDGIGATARIQELGLPARVIALTSFTEDDRILAALQAGASSYLLKDVSPDALVEAIRAAHRGESRLHPEIMQKLIRQVAHPAQSSAAGIPSNLTTRELEVTQLVASGLSNREIAETLVISEKTVKSHISSILGKLGLEDRTKLAIYAIRHGLADPEAQS